MKKIIAIIILSFAIISQSFACSCMMPESPTKSLEKSDIVFIWNVTSVETKEVKTDFNFTTKEKTVVFNVDSVLKWEKNNNITIKTANSWAACWYGFKKDKNYIVYWYKNDKWEYRAGLCSRTSLLVNANEDKKELKSQIENWKIIANNTWEEVTENNNNNNIDYTVAIIIIAVLLGLSLFKLRKH